MVCGTHEAIFTYSTGSQEAFVIGTDYAVWHAWPGSNGWHSLGGVARSALPNGVYLYEGTISNGKPLIYVYGTNNLMYCDEWGSPTWSGWYYCD